MRSQIIRGRESLVLYKSFNTFCGGTLGDSVSSLHAELHAMEITEKSPPYTGVTPINSKNIQQPKAIIIYISGPPATNMVAGGTPKYGRKLFRCQNPKCIK